jgi:dehydrogenase/reductase SDR family protein 7B
MNLKKKYIWITGASSGIGKELAIQLAQKGAKIALTSRTEDKLTAVLNELDGEGHKVFVCDLMQTDSIATVTQEVMKWSNMHLDILINNAGRSLRALIKDITVEVDREIMEIDYFAPIILSKKILPFMVDKKEGMIVNISSVAGKMGTPKRSSYNGAKHAIIGFMDCVRAEYAQDNINVLNIIPGSIRTNISINAVSGDGSKYNTMDPAIVKGLDVSYTVKKIISAIEKEKNEVVIANFKETLATYVKRFFPELLFKLMSKMETT